MLVYSLVIFAIAVVTGLIPLVAKRNDRLLHLFIAFATGVFLGVVFLHFLPEVGRMATEAQATAHDHEHPEEEAGVHEEHEEGEAALHQHGGLDLWFFVLVGVVGLFVLESLVFRGGHQGAHRAAHEAVEHDHGPSATSGHGHASPSHARSDLGDRGEHATVGWTVLFGLSVHAFTAGLGLAATLSRPDLAASVFISIISHKGVEGFSLTTVFMLAGFGRRKILALIGAFALVTPAGVLLGSLLRQHLDNFGVEIMMALAAGTFLFVALGDLLPEVFHRRIDAAYKVLLLLAGIAVSFLIHL